jgi:NADP-dependent 3-hydroxy acid dehydrogenase YdfG
MVQRVALVTGAGSGIGQASALSLAANGYAIGALGHSGDELQDVVRKIETNGRDAISLDARDSRRLGVGFPCGRFKDGSPPASWNA